MKFKENKIFKLKIKDQLIYSDEEIRCVFSRHIKRTNFGSEFD